MKRMVSTWLTFPLKLSSSSVPFLYFISSLSKVSPRPRHPPPHPTPPSLCPPWRITRLPHAGTPRPTRDSTPGDRGWGGGEGGGSSGAFHFPGLIPDSRRDRRIKLYMPGRRHPPSQKARRCAYGGFRHRGNARARGDQSQARLWFLFYSSGCYTRGLCERWLRFPETQ